MSGGFGREQSEAQDFCHQWLVNHPSQEEEATCRGRKPTISSHGVQCEPTLPLRLSEVTSSADRRRLRARKAMPCAS